MFWHENFEKKKFFLKKKFLYKEAKGVIIYEKIFLVYHFVNNIQDLLARKINVFKILNVFHIVLDFCCISKYPKF